VKGDAIGIGRDVIGNGDPMGYNSAPSPTLGASLLFPFFEMIIVFDEWCEDGDEAEADVETVLLPS
jgi:hypothetical protein